MHTDEKKNNGSEQSDVPSNVPSDVSPRGQEIKQIRYGNNNLKITTDSNNQQTAIINRLQETTGSDKQQKNKHNLKGDK